jgi:hypothetical protein
LQQKGRLKMTQMTDETKKILRGRPKAQPKTHDLITNTDAETFLKRVEGSKASRGVGLIKKYYSGLILTPRQAILANCAYCMGYYADGLNDCECPACPCYFYMPYRVKK